MLHKLLRKKAISSFYQESSLHRTLTTFDLVLMGIGAIIGAGVFVLTGIAAATKAGPAVVLSYIVAGLASMFAAMAYAELAASIGGTGSAYNYSYAGFGELIAWMIGWDLLLEYGMSVATVAIGWSGYVSDLFQSLNIYIPKNIITDPFDGGVIDLFALGIILALGLLLCVGVKQSARFNAVIVAIKLLTIAVFIAVASTKVDASNWKNFLPFGFSGVMQGAALVFFAYIGFDAVSTTVDESINPQKSVPIGIILSVFICTLVYVIVSALLTGIVPYNTLNVRSPVANALLTIGYPFIAGIIAAGAIAGLTTVMLVMYYGLTRIALAMARDGLLPIQIATIDEVRRTPVRIIILSGIIMAIIAGFSPIHRAAEMVNIGTLAAFVLVCAGSITLRYTEPNLHRPFKTPYHPLIPILGMIFCLYLMIQLPGITWWRFVFWTVFGLLIYFVYGQRHSVLGRMKK